MSCIIELGMRICLCIGHKSQFPSIEICPRHFYRVFFLHLANRHRTMHLRILARQGRIDLPCSGPVDAQRLPRLQCFLRKRASIICCLTEWFMPFTSYPVLSRQPLYNASAHSAPARSYRLPCSGPVDAQRLPRLRRFLRKRASIICCLTEWLMPFASYPAFSQPSLYNASVHSDQAMWYRLPCSGPVCQLHKLYSSSHCRSASQTVSSERFRCPL